jgi:hypothetical protein
MGRQCIGAGQGILAPERGDWRCPERVHTFLDHQQITFGAYIAQARHCQKAGYFKVQSDVMEWLGMGSGQSLQPT